MEFGHGTEVKKNAEVEAEGGDVAPKLAAGAVSQALSRFQFNDDSPFDEHVDPMKANLLTAECHRDRIFPINPQPSLPQGDLERSRIDRLHEAVPQLVIDVKEAANDDVAELLLDEGGGRTVRRFIRVIRIHSGNSAFPAVAPPPESFTRAQISRKGLTSPASRE